MTSHSNSELNSGYSVSSIYLWSIHGNGICKGFGVSSWRLNTPEDRSKEGAVEIISESEKDRKNSHSLGLSGVR